MTPNTERKYLYLITDHPDETCIGKVEARDKPRPANKNEQTTFTLRNLDSGEKKGIETVVGLGYHDFQGEDDYRNNWPSVVKRKLKDIDKQYLEMAGISQAVN